MKKLTYPLSLLFVALFLVTACSVESNGNDTGSGDNNNGGETNYTFDFEYAEGKWALDKVEVNGTLYSVADEKYPYYKNSYGCEDKPSMLNVIKDEITFEKDTDNQYDGFDHRIYSDYDYEYYGYYDDNLIDTACEDNLDDDADISECYNYDLDCSLFTLGRQFNNDTNQEMNAMTFTEEGYILNWYDDFWEEYYDFVTKIEVIDGDNFKILETIEMDPWTNEPTDYVDEDDIPAIYYYKRVTE